MIGPSGRPSTDAPAHAASAFGCSSLGKTTSITDMASGVMTACQPRGRLGDYIDSV